MIEKGKYQHFKGQFYQVVGTAKHSETEEEFVIYYNLENPEKVWIRPLSMFTECVLIDNVQKRRFELVQ